MTALGAEAPPMPGLGGAGGIAEEVGGRTTLVKSLLERPTRHITTPRVSPCWTLWGRNTGKCLCVRTAKAQRELYRNGLYTSSSIITM